LVGSGLSYPPVPLASSVVGYCKETVRGRGENIEEPKDMNSMASYSFWFNRAFEQPITRQKYLQSLIEGQNISHANFRLAHLLIAKHISNIVVTPNFDDFLARALILFGRQPLVCDYPEMVTRIDPDEQEKIQIIHVHGTYPYYDCVNLSGEIEGRAKSSSDTTSTMGALLDAILWRRSPLVIGYSGWETDVIMKALKKRLQRPLAYNLYWFCYQRSTIGDLPEWLKTHENVYFVVPQLKQIDRETNTSVESPLGDKAVATPPVPLKRPPSEAEAEPKLSAVQVLNEINKTFNLETPLLMRNPLRFFLEQLRNSLPKMEEDIGEESVYFFDKVIEQVEKAITVVEQRQPEESPLEIIRDAERRSRYKEAMLQAKIIKLDELTNNQLVDFLKIANSIATGLSDSPEGMLEATSLFVAISDMLTKKVEEAR
jgi:hypothetical protein